MTNENQAPEGETPTAASVTTTAPEQVPVIQEPVVDPSANSGLGEIPVDDQAFDGEQLPPVGIMDVPVEDLPAGESTEVKDNPESYIGYHVPSGPNPSVEKLAPIFHPLPADADPNAQHISGIPIDVDVYNSALDAFPSINLRLGENQAEWASEFDEASNVLYYNNFMGKQMERPGTKWAQRVPYGTQSLGITRPRPNGDTPGGQMSGEPATLRVREALGLGVFNTIPLFHSGIWISLKAPSTLARVELQQRLDAEKIELGRRSQARIFANDSVYIKNYLVDFALMHVTYANVVYANPLDLKSVVQATDINTLIWALLTTLYPAGYQFHQPCVNDPTKCTYIVRQMIDLVKVHVVDYGRFTDEQLRFMADRNTKHTVEQVKAYQESLQYLSKGLVKVEGENGSLTMQLKVPSVTDYIVAGVSWIEGLANDVQRAFGSDMQGEQRNRYISDRGTATAMSTYAHFVKEIALPGGGSVVDPDTIRITLGDISSDRVLQKNFVEAVQKFIEDATFSVEAIPKFNCPACGRKPTPDELNHPYLSPINIEQLFFTMLGQHIEKALM